MRSRIRTSYIVTEGQKVAVRYLHEQEENKDTIQCVMNENCKALPVLALNEVNFFQNRKLVYFSAFKIYDLESYYTWGPY